MDEEVGIEGWERVYLRLELDHEKGRFRFSRDGTAWQDIGPVLDATRLSDEHAELQLGSLRLDQGFTGAFIGVCVQDLSGVGKHADFDYFAYWEHEA
jgi:xylan 1,4-beta-xylosidase